eukprot:1156520-Pelagomonas_calceolata.AAC.7
MDSWGLTVQNMIFNVDRHARSCTTIRCPLLHTLTLDLRVLNSKCKERRPRTRDEKKWSLGLAKCLPCHL